MVAAIQPARIPAAVAGLRRFICTDVQAFSTGGSVVNLLSYLQNNGTGPAHISTSGVTIAVNGGGAQVINWWVQGGTNPFAVGETCHIGMYSSDTPSFLKLAPMPGPTRAEVSIRIFHNILWKT